MTVTETCIHLCLPFWCMTHTADVSSYRRFHQSINRSLHVAWQCAPLQHDRLLQMIIDVNVLPWQTCCCRNGVTHRTWIRTAGLHMIQLNEGNILASRQAILHWCVIPCAIMRQSSCSVHLSLPAACVFTLLLRYDLGFALLAASCSLYVPGSRWVLLQNVVDN